MATLGRWKQSRRRGVFIRRALSMTLAPQRRIAKRAGVKFWSVAGVQRREKIRPPQLSAAIGYTASGKTRSEVKKSKQKKVLHFSESEKKTLLDKYSPLIKGIAFQWWKSGIVKKEFGNFEQFLYNINCFVSEKLDYYNPSIVGKSGRQLAVSSWMRKAATIFCMRAHVDRQRKLARYDRLNAAEPLVARSWIPFGAKRFLKKTWNES